MNTRKKPICFRFIERKQRQKLAAQGFSIADIFCFISQEQSESLDPLTKRKVSVQDRGVIRYADLLLGGRMLGYASQDAYSYYMFNSSLAPEGTLHTSAGTFSEMERTLVKEMLTEARDSANVSIGKYYGIETVTESEALITFEAGWLPELLTTSKYMEFLEDCFYFQYDKNNIDSELVDLILSVKASNFDIRSVSLYFEKI